MTPEEISPIFISVWIVLMIISFVIFFLGKDAQLKRKLFKPFVIGAGILFLGFVYSMGVELKVFYFMVPLVILISYLNIRFTKFCNSCGKIVINQMFLIPTKFCSKCGEKLQ